MDRATWLREQRLKAEADFDTAMRRHTMTTQSR